MFRSFCLFIEDESVRKSVKKDYDNQKNHYYGEVPMRVLINRKNDVNKREDAKIYQLSDILKTTKVTI